MGVTVRWYDENKRTIYYEFTGRWSWQEFEPAYAQTIDMMDSVDYKVDFIMDMLNSEHIPPGALQRLKRAADMNHRNMGLAVYVGMNPLLQALGNVMVKLYPASASRYPFDFAETIEAAAEKLAKRQADHK